jgi:branched-chain amino acid transport system ATP-binding protein
VLLVDEISMGLAPIIVEQLYEVLGQLAAEGIAILVVEQFVTAISKVADFAAVMRLGRIEAIGEPDDITDLLSEAYLGSVS